MPHALTGGGPPCHVEKQIVGRREGITCRLGEAQVETGLQANAPSLPLHRHRRRAGQETAVFAAVGEKVLFIIYFLVSVGAHEEQAVAPFPCHLVVCHGKRAGDGGRCATRRFAHPSQCLATGSGGRGGRRSGEAGDPHLGKNIERGRRSGRHQTVGSAQHVAHTSGAQSGLKNRDFHGMK